MDVKILGNINTDVLVIGGRWTAIRAAIEVAKAGVRVDLVDKRKVGESGSSPRATIGFSARIGKDDSDRLFYQYCLKASGTIFDQNLVWKAIIRSAQLRSDFPLTSDEWVKHVCTTRKGEDIKTSTTPVVTISV